MSNALLFLAHELLCLALFYAVFCRANKTSELTTKREVRLVLLMEGTIAAVGLSIPLTHDFNPTFFSVCLLGAMVVPKVVFARGWADGPPVTVLKDTANG